MNPLIKQRVEISKRHRLKSKDKGAQKLAKFPWKFRDTTTFKQHAIVIPAVSSENRLYVPLGLIGTDSVANNRVYCMYDAPPCGYLDYFSHIFI